VKGILKDDDSGQFILLMSIVVVIGMIILLVFFNQSLMAGHSSAESIMDFPKNDIRDLRSTTLSEATQIGNEANTYINSSQNTSQSAFNNAFDANFNNYTSQLQEIFEEQGTTVEVYDNTSLMSVNLSNGKTIYLGYSATINLYYNNGETSYDDNTTVYFG